MQIRLSAVLQFFDGYRRRPLRANEATFLVNLSPAQPVYKQNGYFVFSNLNPGNARIDVLSPLFLPETIEVSVPEEPGKYSVYYRVLNPARGYPFGASPTALRGKFMKEGLPAVRERILICIPETRELLKVAQDDLEAGGARIKLFSSMQTWRLPIPGKFMIADRDESRRELCMITGAPDKDNFYPVSEPLLYSHARGSPLVEVMEFRTAADGAFYIAVPERHESLRRVELETPGICPGKSWTAELERGRETDMGVISV